jgi:hypothetical protein
MRRANEELHGTFMKARKEVKSTRSKLGEVVTKQEEKSKIAMDPLKVKCTRELEIALGEERLEREIEINKVTRFQTTTQSQTLTLTLTL